MQGLVAAGDGAAADRVAAAVGVRDEAAGLAHQHEAGGDVPGIQAALPVGVEAAAAT